MIPAARRLALAACALLTALPAYAHVHGQASLAVAVDGPTLTLMLDAPADSLLGFEHPPRTAREREAAAQVRRSLDAAAALFRPAPAAGCTPVQARIRSPLFDAAPAAGATGDGHADIEAEYTFRCRTPARLRALRVDLFDAFPRLKRLQVEVAAPSGQTAARLTPRQREVRW